MPTIIQCTECGAKNRVDERSARLQAKCGQCGAKLDVASSSTASDSKPLTVTDATFDQVLRGAGSRPVLIDAWASWCGPCRSIAPIIDQLAAESKGRYVIGKLDVDENPRTARHYNISGIPTLLVFKTGALVETLVGGRPKAQLAALLAHIFNRKSDRKRSARPDPLTKRCNDSPGRASKRTCDAPAPSSSEYWYSRHESVRKSSRSPTSS